jgi:hypothetical protein
VTASFVGLGLEVETGVRRGRVRPHAAGGRLERLAPTRARPAVACLALPQASSETGESDAADIVPLDGESPEPGTRHQHLSVPRAERVLPVTHRTLASRARGRVLVRSGESASGCDGLTAERVVAAWPAKAAAEVLHLGDRTGRRRAAGRARHPPARDVSLSALTTGVVRAPCPRRRRQIPLKCRAQVGWRGSRRSVAEAPIHDAVIAVPQAVRLVRLGRGPG